MVLDVLSEIGFKTFYIAPQSDLETRPRLCTVIKTTHFVLHTSTPHYNLLVSTKQFEFNQPNIDRLSAVPWIIPSLHKKQLP